MRIKYCGRYNKYVSQQYCEFFNDGRGCGHYTEVHWHSIRDLERDENRPLRMLNPILKPLKCSLPFPRRSYSDASGEKRTHLAV